MTTLRHDLLVAARLLRKNPGFTLVATVTLALGIGANTAIFSVVYGVLLRPLGIEDPAGLAAVSMHREGDPADSSGFWPRHYDDLRQRVEGRAGINVLTSYIYESVTLLGDGQPEELGQALLVESSFFRALGVEPILGRTLGEQDVIAKRRGNRCVISESLWRQQFGQHPEILGRRLILDGEAVEVVGVMPSNVPLPIIGNDLWIAQDWDLEDPTLIGRLNVLARLEPGATLELAAAAMSEAAQAISRDYPRFEGYTLSLSSFHDQLVGSAGTAILASAGAVGLILLIACVNLASLLLARAATREREMATRRALGAQRRQVMSQLLSESVLLSLLGGLLGVAFAFGLHRILLDMGSGLVPRLYDVRLDLPVLGFALLASLLTGLVFGFAPVLYTFAQNLAGSMRGAMSGGNNRRSGLARTRQILMAAEITLAVVLVASAALMVRSLMQLRAVDLGFESAGVGGAVIYLDDAAYPDDAQELEYFRSLLERIAARPEIEAAGATTGMPMDPTTIDYDLPYTLPGQQDDQSLLTQAFFRSVTPDYFRVLKIPLLQGRPFGDIDRSDGLRVAIINQTFARLAWPDTSPVGESFLIYGGRRELRVVGVVGDVRFTGPGADYRPEFFVPQTQTSYGAMTVVARSSSGTIASDVIAREALAVDPTQPVASSFALDDLVAASVSTNRFYTRLLVAFAAVALLLAAAGIYGVISYWVNESRREIGVRIALGADGANIIGLVLRRSLSVTVIGLTLGLSAAVLASRALQQFVYGVAPTDVVALAFVVLVLFTASMAASIVPALRASRVLPMNALRLD